jgi:hypothetical protein
VHGVWFFIIGSLSTAIANVLYAVMDEKASYWQFQFPAMALSVIGPDLVIAVGYIYINSLVESWEVAAAGASLQFWVALAFTSGPSLSTLIYQSLVVTKHGTVLTGEESRKNADLLESLRASFWFWAALCFTCKSRLTATSLRASSRLILCFASLQRLLYLCSSYGIWEQQATNRDPGQVEQSPLPRRTMVLEWCCLMKAHRLGAIRTSLPSPHLV